MFNIIAGKAPKKTKDNRGGIFRANDYLRPLGGTFHIRSICARASNRDEKEFPSDVDFDRSWRFFPGTHVIIQIPRMGLLKGGNL